MCVQFIREATQLIFIDFSYYLKCIEVDQCSGISYTEIFPGLTYKENREVRLPDDTERWYEFVFDHEDYEFPKPRKRRFK